MKSNKRTQNAGVIIMNLNKIKEDIRNGNFVVEDLHDIGGAGVIITDVDGREGHVGDLVVKLDDARAVNTLFITCIEDFGNSFGPGFYRQFALSTLKHDGDLIKIIEDLELFIKKASKVQTSYDYNEKLNSIVLEIVGEEFYSNYF